MKKKTTKQKQCTQCRGPMEKRTVEHPYWYNSNLVALVQNVPGWVCLLCGAHQFEPAVLTTLEKIAGDYVQIGPLFPVPKTLYRETSKL